MPLALRDTLLSVRDLLAHGRPVRAAGPGAARRGLLGAGPDAAAQVVLATGSEQGAYAEFGKRYAALLQQHGIRVELRGTQGAAENLRPAARPELGRRPRLRAGRRRRRSARHRNRRRADEDLVSLGSLFYEPVWLFYREDAARRLLKSDTLLAVHSVAGLAREHRRTRQRRAEPDAAAARGQPHRPCTLTAAAAAADAGGDGAAGRRDRRARVRFGARIADGADAAADAGHQAVRLRAGRGLFAPLRLHEPGDPAARRGRSGARHAPQRRALGGAHRHAGGARDLHPALVQLFVQAASSIHGRPAGSSARASFRAPRNTELPLAQEAERFYRNGPPFCSATCRSGWPTSSTGCGWCCCRSWPS